jgi:hypothetical protein
MSTTTAPVEPGTTYPMPPAPSWASDREVDRRRIRYEHEVGSDADVYSVHLRRSDHVSATDCSAGLTHIQVAIGDNLIPAQARQLAALLIEASATAEGI